MVPSRPSPHKLYEQTGGGDAYRIAMLEHGWTAPAAPWERNRESSSGRMSQCGNTHEINWSEWQTYGSVVRPYEARWCRPRHDTEGAATVQRECRTS